MAANVYMKSFNLGSPNWAKLSDEPLVVKQAVRLETVRLFGSAAQRADEGRKQLRCCDAATVERMICLVIEEAQAV